MSSRIAFPDRTTICFGCLRRESLSKYSLSFLDNYNLLRKPKRNHFRRLLRSRLSVRQNLVYVVASVNSDFKKDRESTDNKNLKLGLKQSPFQEDIERWLRKRRSKEYRMGSLFQHFLEMEIPVELYGDVIHATYQDFEPVVDIFVFPYGAVVTWGLDEESESLVLQTVCSFERTPLSSPEMDSFRYNFGSQWKISRDCITLVETTGERAVLEKLAVSHAMAQSVKLSAFEDSVQNTIAATRHLPEELARYGSISQSRTEISKNLEFFWEYEAFEPLYRSAERYLELRQRAELLNKRVEIRP
ncbi:Sporulation protein RMD1 [Galdieria sulphuraria]|nr:Sporulation protein RMD1 [Galdieria sulphuraria]